MTYRTTVAATALTAVSLFATPVAAQSVPRTSWGDPDLQGVFTFATITPLQRPDDLGAQEVLTEEEARSLEERTARERVDRPPRPGDTGTYNRFWVDYGTQVVGTHRTSLITDTDGKLPPLASAAESRRAARRAAGPQPPSGPEDMTVRRLWQTMSTGICKMNQSSRGRPH